MCSMFDGVWAMVAIICINIDFLVRHRMAEYDYFYVFYVYATMATETGFQLIYMEKRHSRGGFKCFVQLNSQMGPIFCLLLCRCHIQSMEKLCFHFSNSAFDSRFLWLPFLVRSSCSASDPNGMRCFFLLVCIEYGILAHGHAWNTCTQTAIRFTQLENLTTATHLVSFVTRHLTSEIEVCILYGIQVIKWSKARCDLPISVQTDIQTFSGVFFFFLVIFCIKTSMAFKMCAFKSREWEKWCRVPSTASLPHAAIHWPVQCQVAI